MSVPEPPLSDLRDHSIPIRLDDLVALLSRTPSLTRLERSAWDRLATLLESTFHQEFHDELRQLQRRYSAIDPDRDYVVVPGVSPSRNDGSFHTFLTDFDALLTKANFQQMDLAAIREAIEAPNANGLNYEPQLELFEHLRVYVRGSTEIVREVRNLGTRFRKRSVSYPGFRRMVVAFKFRPETKPLDHLVHHDVMYLRLFKDVPRVDMEMHLPEQGARVKMRLIDKAQIASPVAMGLPPLLMKLLATSVLTLTTSSLAAILVAPFSVAAKSFFGFQRAKTKHLHHMIRHLYYLNLANNACVINRVVDLAGQEEAKEAILAYFLLWKGGRDGDEPWTRERLDRAVEAIVLEQAGARIDFEIGDALGKLERLELVARSPEGHLRVVPPLGALAQLDARWDRLFQYSSGS